TSEKKLGLGLGQGRISQGEVRLDGDSVLKIGDGVAIPVVVLSPGDGEASQVRVVRLRVDCRGASCASRRRRWKPAINRRNNRARHLLLQRDDAAQLAL